MNELRDESGAIFQVNGACKLGAPDCSTDDRADCAFNLGKRDAALLLEIDRLRLAIQTYLDHPGCNAQSRATAMAKLRWAMEQRP